MQSKGSRGSRDTCNNKFIKVSEDRDAWRVVTDHTWHLKIKKRQMYTGSLNRWATNNNMGSTNFFKIS